MENNKKQPVEYFGFDVYVSIGGKEYGPRVFETSKRDSKSRHFIDKHRTLALIGEFERLGLSYKVVGLVATDKQGELLKEKILSKKTLEKMMSEYKIHHDMNIYSVKKTEAEK